jgi:hypothetical protein
MSHYDNNDHGRSPRPNPTGGRSCSDPAPQNCSCVWCARPTQAGPPNWHPTEQQDPRHFANASNPYTNQGQPEGVNNRAESVLLNHAAQFAPLQNARTPDNLGFAPIQERAGPPDMRFPWAQALDTSIAESRRRLAGRYLNNPNAYVSTIRLEPGPSGQSQVIITLEMANIV